MTAALRRSRRFLSFETMKRLYKAFRVLRTFTLRIRKDQSKRMEDANFYVISRLFNLPKSCSYEAAGIQFLETAEFAYH